jgi:hypothetical protein
MNRPTVVQPPTPNLTTTVKQPLIADPSQIDQGNVDMNVSGPIGNVATGESDMMGHDQDEQMNIEPIGREYIETRLEGKILSFYCKLCECQFNDPNAKDMHTKGRRHRLAYKKKVDPSLRVDMKLSSGGSVQSRNKISRDRNMNSRQNNTNINNNSNNLTQSPSLSPNSSNTQIQTSGGIMPLMSTNLQTDSSVGMSSAQSIPHLMSQPLK